MAALDAGSQIVSGQTTKTTTELGTHYPALDGLRAIAFLLVFLAHYEQISWTPGGVNIFFVLSGFLITGILWDSRNRPGRARTFYIRRTLRVFPLYYGVLLLAVVTLPICLWDWNRKWLAWPLYLGNFLRVWQVIRPTGPAYTAADAHLSSFRFPHLFLSLGHFWSLCIEEQFYLVWPFLVWVIASRRKLMGVAVAVVVLSPLLRLGLHEVSPLKWGWSGILYSVLQFDGLLLGALIALLWRGAHREAMVRTAKLAFPLFCATAFAVAVVVSHGHVSHFTHGRGYPEWFDWWGLSLLDLLGALLLLRALDPGSLVYRFFTVRSLRWVGRVSYGAYVFHDLPHSVYTYVALKCIDRWPVLHPYPQALTSTIALPTTLLLAGLSYATFESYFLNLKERWAPSRSSQKG